MRTLSEGCLRHGTCEEVGEDAMTTTPALKLMPELPRPGQKVRWRNPQDARRSGWEAVFGPGPFEVFGLADRTDQGLVVGIVVRTGLGVREIPEVWLALADEPEKAASGRRAVSVAQA
jgi:hypothetical protein